MIIKEGVHVVCRWCSDNLSSLIDRRLFFLVTVVQVTVDNAVAEFNFFDG